MTGVCEEWGKFLLKKEMMLSVLRLGRMILGNGQDGFGQKADIFSIQKKQNDLP